MEIFHEFGNDLILNSRGDIEQVESIPLTQQSIIRRLLTNHGTYIWHPEYGAGIGIFVGKTLSEENFITINNLMVSQILMEQTVAKTPLPQTTLTPVNGTVLVCNVIYWDAVTNTQQTISFQVA